MRPAVRPGTLHVRVCEIAALPDLQKVEQGSELRSGGRVAANRTSGGIRRCVDARRRIAERLQRIETVTH